MLFRELFNAIQKSHIVVMSENEFMRIVYEDCMEKVYYEDENGNELDYEYLPRFSDLQELADNYTDGFDVSIYKCIY